VRLVALAGCSFHAGRHDARRVQRRLSLELIAPSEEAARAGCEGGSLWLRRLVIITIHETGAWSPTSVLMALGNTQLNAVM
jgi:hypothetical protein